MKLITSHSALHVVFYPGFFVVTFLPSLNMGLKCICCLACNRNVYIYLESTFRNTNLIWKIKTSLTEYAKMVSFMSFLWITPPEIETFISTKGRGNCFLCIIFAYKPCVHTWLQRVPLQPLSQRDFVWLHIGMKPLPQGNTAAQKRREHS